ncbi:MAG: response regulator, partial [Myxococcales bacterium]|nr:response regulator [Myxococcales bacterium]
MTEASGQIDESLPRHRVLVVDDERNIRRALRMILESEGYETLDAQTAEEAEQRLSRGGQPVDLILLDLM